MPTFLSPLLRDPGRAWSLAMADTGVILAHRVQAAVDSASRRRGLLGRTSFDDEALIIAPSRAVHTFFMRFPIDVIFTDRDGRIARCAAHVRPWRLAAALWAFATIELPAGTIERAGVRRGARVELRAAARTRPTDHA